MQTTGFGLDGEPAVCDDERRRELRLLDRVYRLPSADRTLVLLVD